MTVDATKTSKDLLTPKIVLYLIDKNGVEATLFTQNGGFMGGAWDYLSQPALNVTPGEKLDIQDIYYIDNLDDDLFLGYTFDSDYGDERYGVGFIYLGQLEHSIIPPTSTTMP